MQTTITIPCKNVFYQKLTEFRISRRLKLCHSKSSKAVKFLFQPANLSEDLYFDYRAIHFQKTSDIEFLYLNKLTVGDIFSKKDGLSKTGDTGKYVQSMNSLGSIYPGKVK